MTLPEKDLGPPRQAGEAPIRKIGTPPELTAIDDHLRHGVGTTPGPISAALRREDLPEAPS